MIVKSVFMDVFVEPSSSALGFVPLWIGLAAFSLALALYRKNSKIYQAAVLYYCLIAVAFGAAAISERVAFPALAFPLATLFIALSRAVLARVSARACDMLVPRTWSVISVAVGVLVVAGTAAAIALGPAWYGPIAAVETIALAIHALLAIPFYLPIAKTAPAAVRIIAGFVPWALAWMAAAAISIADAFGWRLLPPFSGLAAPALMAAEALMGIGLLLALMLELAKPAPEDTALDDYAAKITASVTRFIPTEFLQHLQKADFFDLKLGDHVKKDMTIFFSDIRAFTELSERLTPEESFAFINSYLSRVVPVIKEHGGFVDKYMGDGIMALFASNGGADDAVESAVEMQKKMIVYNGHRAKMDYRPISMGIGIHTGPLMLGVVGVTDRMEGTVISDAVNLSSRLQSIAKAFNIPLVISERTFMQLGDPGKYKYRFIGKVRVKGKDAPVSVFEIFDGLPDELFERKMKSNTFFEQGMLAYYQKDYSQGVFYFKRALESVPEDGASRFYLETCLRKAMAPAKIIEKPAQA